MNTELTQSKKSQLEIRLEKRGIDQMLWSAIGSSIFPGATDESKLMAIDYCKSRGLDIMKKPCHIVPMNVKDAKTNQYAWRDVIMPGIAEIRITADRTGKYAGQDAPVFGPMVEMDFGKATHTVPESCTVTVYRIIDGNRVAFSHTEFFEEAANTTKDGALNSMWTKRKRGQLSKCAEAGALRKAFPEESGGVITAEEVSDDHLRTVSGRVVDTPTKPTLRFADPYQEPPQSPEPTPEPERSSSPPPESPVEVSTDTEQAALFGEIKAALKSTEDTGATFAVKCREAGLLPSGMKLQDAPAETLREILAQVTDISNGSYIPLN